MSTIILAWINAHYNYDYEFLFVGTVIIDIKIIESTFRYIEIIN